jgi:UDP-3-O-[3-hydroxymyristoyl] glucosamine N-acyltransferase
VHPSAVIEQGARVDPTAEIEAFVTIGRGAQIGAGTRVGAGSTVGAGVAIGDHCVLHPRVSIYDRVTIGARCIIHAGAVIGADGFGFEMADIGFSNGPAWGKVPQVGTVTVGDDVEIGANSCIDRSTLGATVIGDGTKLDNMVHIGHNCRIGRHVVIAAQTGLAGGVTIGDYAVVGGQVGVGDKARIESKAIIGSGAGILTSKIVRAGEPVWGTPARPLRQYLEQLATLARLAKRRGSK